MGRLVLILSSQHESVAEKLGWYPQVTSGSNGSFSLFSAAIRRLKKSSLSFTAGIVPEGRTQSSIDKTSDAIVSAVNTGWSCCATKPGTITFSANVLSMSTSVASSGLQLSQRSCRENTISDNGDRLCRRLRGVKRDDLLGGVDLYLWQRELGCLSAMS